MEDLILQGDVYACLDALEDGSVAVAITSPPYWKQRDYGFDGQIGQEETPEHYIGRLLVVFEKLKEKLREDGVFFLNVGDKYLPRYGKSHLLQIPYRLCFHMVRNGWRLEDVLIWHKPNHMPSSAKDRFTNTYEPVLVLAKSENNIYKKGLPSVVEVALEQTPWKHTAVFPEGLVEELLGRVVLKDGDSVLDPFAGTGTVAVVVNKLRSRLFRKQIASIMIEKDEAFVRIISERAGIANVKRIESLRYDWEPVKEEGLPESIKPEEIMTSRYGEVFVADTSEQFLSALKGITTERFRRFHKENALYFMGVKRWTLQDLYYPHSILREGYVLRNMIVNSDGKSWYPIFMFAKDDTKAAYKFYLDRVRIAPKTVESRNWQAASFVGFKVVDVLGKKTKEGRIVEVLKAYEDGFPKVVVVRWDGQSTVEFALHPSEDEIVMEGVIFKCPKCFGVLEEPYDPAEKQSCPHCGTALWSSLETLPILEEPPRIVEAFLAAKSASVKEAAKIDVEEPKKKSKSKFFELDRINWGSSPGARKVVLGEYFSKMRLYRIDQPVVAQYLGVLRKSAGLSVQDVIDALPKSHKHTVGHWFRKDLGGSIPLPEDLALIRQVFKEKCGSPAVLGALDALLRVLEKTALKFQTVRASVKGKNPGDFLSLDDAALKEFLEKLYLPPQKYIETLKRMGC